MTEARLCQIDSGDIAELIALGEEANLSAWSQQNYLDEIKNPHSIMLRLEGDSNDLIGFIVGRLVTAPDVEDAVDAEIYNIAVDNQYRRRGHAQRILNEFCARCRASCVRSVWLEVRESNHPAIRLYEKNGFQTVTKRRDFYSNPPEDGLLMRRELA